MASAAFSSLPTEESGGTNGAMLQELDLEGEMSAPIHLNTDDSSTLDEPIKETFLRDAKAIGTKFKQIFLPTQSKQQLLRDWDLWGPLIICVVLALLMQGTDSTPSSDASYPEFADIFIIFWIGSIVVTVNSKLLGGHISFFQCVCVLGYCVLPLAIALILCRIILLAVPNWKVSIAIRLISVVLGLGWATYASVIFLAASIPPAKKALGLYPIFLFYTVIGWLILSTT